MRIQNIVPALLAAAALLAGCRQPLADATITVNKDVLSFGYGGGEETISVRCGVDWTATADAWITLSPASGYGSESAQYMTVIVAKNDTDPREGHIAIQSTAGTQQAVTVKQGEDPLVLRSAEQFTTWLADAENYTVNDKVTIGADLDLAGVTLPHVGKLSCSIDGKGHTIRNWAAKESLVATLEAGAYIKDLVFDRSCSYTFPETPGNAGLVVADNHGTVSGIVSNVDATVPALVEGAFGGIVGYTYDGGSVTDCINNGNLSYTGPGNTAGSLYFGGVSGRLYSSEKGSSAISGCENHGNVTFQITDATTTKSLYVAGVTGSANSYAKTLNCKNFGDITIRTAGFDAIHFAAGIVCYSAGEVSGCTNEGAVSLLCESADGKADGAVKTAGVAGISAYQGSGNGEFSGCTNKGAITLRGGYSTGYSTVGSLKLYSTAVGGLIASTFKCKVSESNNSGAVTSVMGAIDLSTAAGLNTNTRHSAAGIVGSCQGDIENCVNDGPLEIRWVTTTHDAAFAKQFVCQAGGITGGAYNATDKTNSSLSGCTNNGSIHITCDSAGSNNAFGGIDGWPGSESAAQTAVSTDCTNKGNITVEGFGKHRVGGVHGGSGTMLRCANYGKVHFKSGKNDSGVGGLAGYRNFLNTTESANYGDVISEVALSWGVGGLVGGTGNTEQTLAGCKVNCKVQAPDDAPYASMLIGRMDHNKSGAKNIYLGTDAAPIHVKGSFGATALTADNFRDYLKYKGFNEDYSSNIHIVAQYGD